MTLTLTYTNPVFGQLAADRLVTRGSQPFDRESNKTVLVMGYDGAFVVGYAGAAHLGSRFTDEVIASAAAGSDLSAVTYSFSMRVGGRLDRRDVGRLVLDICHAVRHQADRVGLRHDLMPQLTILGWKWDAATGRRVERFVWSAHRPRPRSGYVVGRPLSTTGLSTGLYTMPGAYVSATDRAALIDNLVRMGDARRRTSAALVATIRTAASAHPIGTDVMVVTMPDPSRGETITIDFDGTPSSHGGFSPWIIAPSGVVVPTVLTSGFNFPFGPWRVILTSRSPAGGGKSIGIRRHHRRRP